MFNLIRKELILNKKALLISLCVVTAYLLWAAATIESLRAYIFIASIMSGFMLPVNIQGQEDKFKTAILNCSLPFRRSTIVLARYMTIWLIMLAGTVYVLGIGALIPFTRFPAGNIFNPQVFLSALLFISILIFFLYPFVIRFGVTGMMIFLVFTQVLGIILLFLTQYLGKKQDILRAFIGLMVSGIRYVFHHEPTLPYFFILLAAIIVLNFISLKISQALYARRDF